MTTFIRVLFGLVLLFAAATASALYVLSDPDIPAAALEAEYGGPASRFVTLPSGARAHYRDQGNAAGTPLVLLHGSNASLHTWEPWVQRLGDTFRVVTVDLPAHGLTGAVPGDDYSQEGMAQFVDAFTTAIGLPRFALGGNSMGGGVAARFALLHPERVSHLILVDAAGFPSRDETKRRPPLGFVIARTPVVQNVMLFLTPRRLFADGLRATVADDALVTEAMIDRYWELNRREGTRAASLKRFQTPFDGYIAENAWRIAAPTLILWGSEDTLTPPDIGDQYRAAIAGSVLKVYPGIGHIPMEEAPDQSAADVRAFLTAPAS